MRPDVYDSPTKDAPPDTSGGNLFRRQRASTVLRRAAGGRGRGASSAVQGGGARPRGYVARERSGRSLDALLADVVV